MPVNVVRLRKWLAAAAILLVCTVAGVYFYGRWRVSQAVREVPRHLGLDIEQSTQGFSLSKSEGGHTIFTVRASKAVQYKPGGRAELRDVHILVYGGAADRYDQIYGEHFEYDPASGNVTALGEVQIDLQGTLPNAIASGEPPAPKLKDPIHLRTSGLTFNQKTGIASTDQPIQVRTTTAEGSARGATYDSRTAVLTLHSNVRFRALGPQPATVTAARAVIARAPSGRNQLVLDDIELLRAGRDLHSDKLQVFLRDDNSVDRLLASGNVRAITQEGSRVTLTSPDAEARMASRNEIRWAAFSGGVSVSSEGERMVRGTAGRLELEFGGSNVLTTVVASENVDLLQSSGKSTARGQTVEVRAPAMTFNVSGRSLRQAVSSGAGEVITTRPNAAGSERILVSAGKLAADFDTGNRLRRIFGLSDAKVVETAPGQPDRIATSRSIEASFDPAGQIQEIVQSGNFHYQEGQDLHSGGSAARQATAQQARFVAAENSLILLGSPWVQQAGMTTSASSIRLNRRTGEALAEGDVKTTYSDLRPQPGGALLATADPIHVTADRMTARESGGVAVYFGGDPGGAGLHNARLWQGANIVEAPTIEFNRDQRSVVAKSTAGSVGHTLVSTTLVQRDRSGRTTTVSVTAARLSYVDAERQIRFEGGVTIRTADATVTARQVDVLLQPAGKLPIGQSSGPSRVDKIIATGGVLIQQQRRQAHGEKLVYIAENGSFTLTGGPPSIFDAERGKITGDSLTFFSRDDTVRVQGSSSAQTLSQTRVAK